MPETIRPVRILNDEKPDWATHGVAILLDSSGGHTPDQECRHGLVTWCASEAEMDRVWNTVTAINDAGIVEHGIKLLDALDTTIYAFAVDDEAGEAQITFETR